MLAPKRVQNILNSKAAPTHSAWLEPPSFTPRDRFRYLALIALSSLTLLLARWLRPAPRGVGTHEQLGLPPCLFLHFTGFPCPSCGLTTSFAHAARLHFYQSFITQPFGLIAFCLTLLSIPLALYLIHRRIAWSGLMHARSVNVLLYILLALYVLGWIYKLLVTQGC